jgi:hypothetical protein
MPYVPGGIIFLEMCLISSLITRAWSTFFTQHDLEIQYHPGLQMSWVTKLTVTNCLLSISPGKNLAFEYPLSSLSIMWPSPRYWEGKSLQLRASIQESHTLREGWLKVTLRSTVFTWMRNALSGSRIAWWFQRTMVYVRRYLIKLTSPNIPSTHAAQRCIMIWRHNPVGPVWNTRLLAMLQNVTRVEGSTLIIWGLRDYCNI